MINKVIKVKTSLSMAVNVPQGIGSKSENIELIFLCDFLLETFSLMATALYDFAYVERT